MRSPISVADISGLDCSSRRIFLSNRSIEDTCDIFSPVRVSLHRSLTIRRKAPFKETLFRDASYTVSPWKLSRHFRDRTTEYIGSGRRIQRPPRANSSWQPVACRASCRTTRTLAKCAGKSLRSVKHVFPDAMQREHDWTGRPADYP